MRLGKLLSQYGVKGTFYIPKEFHQTSGKFSAYDRRLTDEEIRQLTQEHEVGSHTLTHALMDRIAKEEVKNEIEKSKEFLEGVTGKAIQMFCYPGGVVTDEAITAVKSAGYKGARTIDKLNFGWPYDVFLMPVSIQCISFPFRKKDPTHYYWGRLLDPVRAYRFKLLPFLFHLSSWQSFARASLRHALKNGSTFHLMGHSWELEKYDLWGELEDFLRFARSIPEVRFVTNSEIVSLAADHISNS